MTRLSALTVALALAACAHSEPADPHVPLVTLGARPAGAKNLPPMALFPQAVSRPVPHLPDLVKIQHKGETVEWVAKVCSDTSGAVVYVGVLRTFKGADPDIANLVWKWRFQPWPQPVCSLLHFVFSLS